MKVEFHEEWKHENASGGGSIHPTRESALLAMETWELNRLTPRIDEPPMAPSVGIRRRLVTDWGDLQTHDVMAWTDGPV